MPLDGPPGVISRGMDALDPFTGEGLAYRHGVLLLAGALLLWAFGCTFFWCLVAVNPREGEASSPTLRSGNVY